jgi:hypothetical protein
MGFDIGQGFVLLDKVIQHDTQQRVLVDIGGVSRVVNVLIAEHVLRLAPQGRKFKSLTGGRRACAASGGLTAS